MSVRIVCFAEAILHTTDGVLDLALSLIHLSLGLHFAIAYHTSEEALQATHQRLRGTFDTVMVHTYFLLNMKADAQASSPVSRVWYSREV
jgi:hypothetical protein